MAANLYEALGVAKDATVETIRAAYRKAAKKAHPDAGGSLDRFALVKVAVDCLTDDDRRAHYDRTGQIGDKPPDQRFTNALQMVFAAVDGVLSASAAQGIEDFPFDVVAHATHSLDIRLKETREQIAAFDAKADGARKLARRFTARKGKTNHLSRMLSDAASNLDRSAATARLTEETIQMAIGILNDHRFEYAEPPMQQHPLAQFTRIINFA